MLFVFAGGWGESRAEALVAACQQAIALDLLDRAARRADFDEVVTVTSDAGFASLASKFSEIKITEQRDFHFGRCLTDLVNRRRADKVVYVGAGSAPLLAQSELAQLARLTASEQNVVVANNVYSADFVGFSPGHSLASIDPPATDNDLAWLLCHGAGLSFMPLPPTLGTRFDVDTPTDVAILSLYPLAEGHLKQYIESVGIDQSVIRRAASVLADPSAQVIVAGRVSSSTWRQLERSVPCQIRVFSEERGMRASGREAKGEVKSLLGLHLAAVGPHQLFESLAELGQAAFIDTRVLFAHLGLTPGRVDRYSSDTFECSEISDPVVREFTIAASEAPIPVVLGGHSLVTGGLLALSELVSGRRLG